MPSQLQLIVTTIRNNVGSITAGGANLLTVAGTIRSQLGLTFTPNTDAYVFSVLNRYFDGVGMSLDLRRASIELDNNQAGVRITSEETGVA